MSPGDRKMRRRGSCGRRLLSTSTTPAGMTDGSQWQISTVRCLLPTLGVSAAVGRSDLMESMTSVGAAKLCGCGRWSRSDSRAVTGADDAFFAPRRSLALGVPD